MAEHGNTVLIVESQALYHMVCDRHLYRLTAKDVGGGEGVGYSRKERQNAREFTALCRN